MRKDPNAINEVVCCLPDEGGLVRDHARLLRFASKECKGYGYDPNTLAEDFLNEAIMNLYEGSCPADCEQSAYLTNRIRQLVSNYYKKDKRRKTSPREDIEDVVSDREEDSEESLVLEELSQKVCDAILNAAAEKKDEEVESMMLAYMDGHEKREDILLETGHTRVQYEAAKKRLETILRNLPAGLYDAVLEALGGDA